MEHTVVRRHYLVICGQHLGVDQPPDGILQKIDSVDRFHARFRHLQHDGPIRPFLGLCRRRLGTVSELQSLELVRSFWLVEWRIIGEDGSTVKGAVVFGEVELIQSKLLVKVSPPEC